MPVDTFFDDPPTKESLAKIDIVSNFFASWLSIIGSKSSGPLAYMELFAGAGIYADGTKSTPIRVLETILASPHASRFHVVLNELDTGNADRLEKAVNDLNIEKKLATPPRFFRKEVNATNSTEFLDLIPNCPTVLFVDPFGYLGLTRELFKQFVSVSWGRDAIAFFNYTRINAALSDDAASGKFQNMKILFGDERAVALRHELSRLTPKRRMMRVHEAMEQSLREAGVMYIQRFEFEERHDSLFFMTMHKKGLKTMKDVMAPRSTKDAEGVPSFSYQRDPEARIENLSFDFVKSPLQELKLDLLKSFAGRRVNLDQLYDQHSPGKNFVRANYGSAVAELETAGMVKVEGPKSRRPGTFGPNTIIAFPTKG